MSFGNRLKQVRSHFNVEQNKMAKLLNMQSSALGRYELDNTVPSIKVANSIVDKITYMYINIDPNWLLTGKGSMLLDDKEQKQPISTNKGLNKTNNVDLVRVPHFEGVYASAGDGMINYEDQKSIIIFDKNYLLGILGIMNLANIHTIKAFGNSMEPTINSGDFLFVIPFENEANTIREGSIYSIVYYEETLVKRVYKDPKTKIIRLISDNDKIKEPIIINKEDKDELKIIGRVVANQSNIKIIE